MEFLKHLKEDFDSLALRKQGIFKENIEERFPRSLQGIMINEQIYLSIQASCHHYCSPRKTLANLKDYVAMELAILKDGEFVSAKEVIANIPLIKQLDDYFEGMVYPYVPVELIEQLYQELIN